MVGIVTRVKGWSSQLLRHQNHHLMKTNEIEVIFQCTYFAKRADWDQKLQQTMVEIFPLKSADAAYSKISGMLSTLGDPFTRIISPTVCMLVAWVDIVK